ncbi:MAG: type VI secretion system baseplate subunit TssE [Chromatiaceae bacterium]|nr:MAG: type VI secretion system baseplate subunit TssE [Chromatiaceae bacterium]
MAELTPRERLQPSLLDRLTDQHPQRQEESRDERVLSPRQLKASVIRDLQWLFNCCDLDSVQPLAAYPEVLSSVVNYGLPDLAGRNLSGIDLLTLERELRQAILRYEPRILRQGLQIRVLLDDSQMSTNAIRFDIEGELWGNPMPQRLYLRTSLDLENGEVRVNDAAGR